MLMPNPVSDARALATIRADYQSWYDRPHEYVPSTPGGGCATCGYGLGAFFHNSFEVQRHMESPTGRTPKPYSPPLHNMPQDPHPAPAPADPHWSKCPDCKQSATGKYLGKFGCARCGWQEGVTDRRKVFI